ncbi:MAG: BREX system P-loop protein BrxC [Peptococcaceae bacterium]|jgi:hypothetical protein|nr:BREX system P-loop protein BrxC [Peptococcaceae bacterium]
MKIRELFAKDIARNIQGVVKVGQDGEAVVVNELEEYVVTRELNRHFDTLFENYREGTASRTDKIGVWISGFFGSGKSHFLKIISYLLSGKEYAGLKAAAYFDGKITDPRVLAGMNAAGDISADVILFNIDAKSDSDSKVNKDPIVKVFMKVFNELRGFCGSMPWIADLERQMSASGTYGAFREKFAELSGGTWEAKREDFYFEEDAVIGALAATQKMSEDAARSWYDKSEANYAIDIAAFARRVREYIELREKQLGKKHYVIFLVDELGQYMGTDNGILLNLQTVVETLGTECGGRAWIIATGQEDISSIVNETKADRDDFSKIIGRFDTRLSLSSANVDEVIKKRLLAKTDAAAERLRRLYADKNAVIRNLITFSHDTPEKKLYADAGDFADVYPFVPYQFKLLQEVFTGIRTHGASGKHLSEGERSLLNGFQEAARLYGEAEDGTLIPFQAFYPTVETFLDHNIRIVITNAAENSRLRPEDVDVLKVLFLVKYIADKLPANLENLAAIMLPDIGQDKLDAKKRIDESLRRLDREKLIIKNGEQYIFLTNEEQDVNREIQEISVDRGEIIEKTGDLILSELFGVNRKYRYSDRYDFAFNFIIDDRPRGNQKEEIGVRALTPYYARVGEMNHSELGVMSLHEQNVILCLPADTSFIDEMERALQIDAYIRRNSGKLSTDAVEDIKTTKTRESQQRKERCRALIVEALKTADIYVHGSKLDIKEKAPGERVNDALKSLVEGIYTKQSYITAPFYSTEDLRGILTAGGQDMPRDTSDAPPGMSPDTSDVAPDAEAVAPNALAIEEMADSIARSSYRNVPVTMRSILDLFSKAPYGWKDHDIAGVLLTLFKKQTVRLELGGKNVAASDPDAVSLVTKRDYSDRLVVGIRVKVSPALLANAKDLTKELFGAVHLPGDEDGLMSRLKDLARAALYEQTGSIKDLLANYARAPYPGKDVLEQGRSLLTDILAIHDVKSFFETLQDRKEDLLDYEEDAQDVRKFFAHQEGIFDKALKMLAIYENNRSYVLDEPTVRVIGEIERIVKLSKPYAEIHKLPDLMDEFGRRFSGLLEEECDPIEKDIRADYEAVKADAESKALTASFGSRINGQFRALLERLAHANNIYEAIAMRTESDRLKLRLCDEIQKEYDRLRRPEPPETAADDQGAALVTPAPAPPRKIKTVSVRSLFSGTAQVSSKADIDRLLSGVKEKLEAQLDENTTVKIV